MTIRTQKSALNESVHRSVLLHSSIEGLGIKAGDCFLDCTVNGGGHALAVAELYGTKVKIVGLDVDRDAIERSEKRLTKAGADFALANENFRNLDKALDGLVAEGKIKAPSADRILFDLGWSSNQFELSGRGFSFQKDEPLLMTLGDEKNSVATAGEIINSWEEEVLADIFFGYGEERFARRIARTIVKEREKKEIKTTGDLVALIEKSVPAFYRNKKTHPATKTFQALRIAVNDELGALREGLRKAWLALAPKGRIAVITFHSIEDRIVKRAFRERASADEAILVTKKPIVPSKDELKENPRARSAKLRIIEKI